MINLEDEEVISPEPPLSPMKFIGCELYLLDYIMLSLVYGLAVNDLEIIPLGGDCC